MSETNASQKRVVSQQRRWQQGDEDAIQRACDYIAPTWPLDQSIAVNPWWKFRHQSYATTAQTLKDIANVHGYASPSFYLDAYQSGRISDRALELAAQRLGFSAEDVPLARYFTNALTTLNVDPEPSPQLRLFSTQVDTYRNVHYMRWQEEIIHQMSQFCAAHFQAIRPMLGKVKRGPSKPLYKHWLEVTRVDYGLSIVLSAPKLRLLLQELPETPEALLEKVVQDMGIRTESLESMALASLYDIHGWASWIAYRNWQKRLAGAQVPPEQDEMRQLLAIRMAWEWLVFTYLKRHDKDLHQRSWNAWRDLWQQHDAVQKQKAQPVLQLGALALELEYQADLEARLSTNKERAEPAGAPWLQAVFCIDVRSEVIRRALESQHDGIETKGFAGFFGVPLAYAPQGSGLTRSQTPGLLSPALRVEEVLSQENIKQRVGKLNQKARIQTWAYAAPSAFSMVESMGLLYGAKLLRGKALGNVVNDLSHAKSWRILAEDQALPDDTLADIALSVLRAMAFESYAPTVLLVGHASQSCNNLQAAALDCGACCGQSGEINSRVLAQILNHRSVRQILAARGVDVPDSTTFVPALHNTTTDDIEVLEPVPAADQPMPLQEVLDNARDQAQSERLARFEPEKQSWSALAIDKLMRRRAQDWAQQRPEWGLVDNAAFIMAPRSWTRGVNLQGRTFLHDYQQALDPDGSVLTLLMTAPMIVAHWINMQYNFAVTEPTKFGSGNKLLHNAVGGSIGVFEGNAGDLRIGLARQSVFDGKKWLHTPQRLTVVIAADQALIARIVEQHDDLQQLVDNDWTHLLQWQQGQPLQRFYQGAWAPAISKQIVV